MVARTDLGLDERVVIAGHLDTVPLNDNLPVAQRRHLLHGLGTCDMKGGVAVALRLAHDVAEPNRDVTYVFYECEEVEADRNGLGRIAAERPDLVEADFAILMEPATPWSRPAARAPCGSRSRAAVSAPTPPGPGAGSTRSTRPARCSAGSTRTSHGSRSSTGWSTARGSTRC